MNINALAVETAHLAAKAVTAAKIADVAISDTQLAVGSLALTTLVTQPTQIYAPTTIATNWDSFAKVLNAAVAFTATITPVTRTLRLVPIFLRKGQVVTSISFTSVGAANTPLNWWFALFSPAGARLSQSADQATAAWAGTTTKTLALAAAQTIAADGVYYVGYMMQATILATLLGFNLVAVSTNVGNTADNALTATAPANIGAITAATGVPIVTLT